MNKLVYLFELDSVRNSDKEIVKGQQVLFEEIVLNGNQVVLTFNQLTDSETFLNLLMEEKTYQCVVELFKMGAIKVSLFRNYRTPSQYVQDAIEKCKSGRTTFLFSGIPILTGEKDLLDKLELALRYNDIGILRELLKAEKDAGNEPECRRITFLIHYIQLILLLSSEEYATNAPNTQISGSYIQYMDYVLAKSDVYLKKSRNGKKFTEDYSKAITVLKEIREQYNSEEFKSGINNRSDWISKMLERGETKDICIANAIIDLCYNYTVEESILGVSRHYNSEDEDSFIADFVERLDVYLQEWQDGVHMFPTKDIQRDMQSVCSKVAWNTAVRIVNNVKRKNSTTENRNNETDAEPLLYERNFKKEKKTWTGRVVWGMSKYFLVTIAYIILFGVTEIMMGELEGLVENAHILSGIWYDIIFSIVIFSILGSVFSEVTRLPDLLESFKNMGRGMVDCIYLMKAKKNVAYKKL